MGLDIILHPMFDAELAMGCNMIVDSPFYFRNGFNPLNLFAQMGIEAPSEGEMTRVQALELLGKLKAHSVVKFKRSEPVPELPEEMELTEDSEDLDAYADAYDAYAALLGELQEAGLKAADAYDDDACQALLTRKREKLIRLLETFLAAKDARLEVG
jgi:hypothetical protein